MWSQITIASVAWTKYWNRQSQGQKSECELYPDLGEQAVDPAVG